MAKILTAGELIDVPTQAEVNALLAAQALAVASLAERIVALEGAQTDGSLATRVTAIETELATTVVHGRRGIKFITPVTEIEFNAEAVHAADTFEFLVGP